MDVKELVYKLVSIVQWDLHKHSISIEYNSLSSKAKLEGSFERFIVCCLSRMVIPKYSNAVRETPSAASLGNDFSYLFFKKLLQKAFARSMFEISSYVVVNI